MSVQALTGFGDPNHCFPDVVMRYPTQALSTYTRLLSSLMSHTLRAIRDQIPAIMAMLVFVEVIINPVTPLSKSGTHLPAGDAEINAYLVNWGQHILPLAPWKYYDAPLFYPQNTAGAFSSANPLLCLVSSPLRLSGNPI